MKRRILFLSAIVSLITVGHTNSSYFTKENFHLLFNEKDLDGWVNVNCAPETWTVKNKMIICSGTPTGVLRTTKQYENFILELDWLHLYEGGNAGLFIHSDAITAPGKPFTRSIECQIMDGNHGDMFAIHGATLTPDNEDPRRTPGWMRSYPTEERVKPAGEWNHYRVISQDGILSLEINGKMVTRGFHLRPRKGYICLESEGSEVHFKDIRIMELPASTPMDLNCATPDEGYYSLYNGADLRGWRSDNIHNPGWKTDNWILRYEKVEDPKIMEDILWSTKDYDNFVLIVDWRLSSEPIAKNAPIISLDGTQEVDENGDLLTVPILDAGNGGIILRGSEKSVVDITCWPIGSGGIINNENGTSAGAKMHNSILPLIRADQSPGAWNRFEVTVEDKQVNIILNGKTVVHKAQLPGLADRGPIGLMPLGSTIEFANIYIKEIKPD